MPMSSDERERWGRVCERVDNLQTRMDRLDEDFTGRKRESRAIVVSWWQVAIAGVFAVAASFGSAALVLVFG